MPVKKIFPRDCFVCGKQMTLAREERSLLECVACDVSEDGSRTRRRRHLKVLSRSWCGELVEFTDHSRIYSPSPDVMQLVVPGLRAAECSSAIRTAG